MKYIKSILLAIIIGTTNISPVLADVNDQRRAIKGLDPEGVVGGGAVTGVTLNSIILRFVDFAVGSAAAAFTLIFIWGAFTWLTSQGDKAALESAKSKITSALIGLIIVATAYAIYTVVKAITLPTLV